MAMPPSKHSWPLVDEQLSFSVKACWTCRRKRVKCDGRLPTCFKCRTAGRECLGYGRNRPLVWAGIASRGKMAGRTFDGQATASSETPPPTTPPNHEPIMVAAISNPVFQDLSHQSKQYISYYLHRCCGECTLYPDDSKNRFGQFLALIPGNPVLTHSLIAVSATHQAQEGISLPGALAESGRAIYHLANWNGSKPLSKSSLTQHSDALTHSALGIGALRERLAGTDFSDALLAAVFLLIWVDVVDSGRSSWKFHLEGLSVLISLRRTLRANPDGSANTHFDLDFHNWFEETFAVLAIFGSTFTPRMLRLLDIIPKAELKDTLVRVESHTWTGCPADLMLVLHALTMLSSEATDPSDREDAISEWFARLRDFDCASWTEQGPHPSSARGRRALVEAWKGSIEIYGRRALGRRAPRRRGKEKEGEDKEEEELVVPDDLVELTLLYLERIDHRDMHFKGTVWPLFVVGAEARTARQRRAVTDIARHLIEYLRMSTLHAALVQLERIWARSEPYPPGKSWIHDIWERGEGLLLV
ncbi:fungal-specific transcription factor domain-containing protein [Durotheca rogersii]|uniref:fungal-specific transcription factor domain-containing protein n=1 Tax=Durotheca rogersii TaxID=419775 RepID=UPI00221F589D|nr:fungal-specific transcription factor domain-containing protein [Durotheca rogersii]KAI5866740.1 fungal-specific transcription factor domain-containing protein [Durotheca rogersii]